MIQLPQGFQIVSKESVDSRLMLTKAEMRAMSENILPDVYFAVCKEDGRIYTYNSKNEFDEETGKYRTSETDSVPISAELIKNLFSDKGDTQQ